MERGQFADQGIPVHAQGASGMGAVAIMLFEHMPEEAALEFLAGFFEKDSLIHHQGDDAIQDFSHEVLFSE